MGIYLKITISSKDDNKIENYNGHNFVRLQLLYMVKLMAIIKIKMNKKKLENAGITKNKFVKWA